MTSQAYESLVASAELQSIALTECKAARHSADSFENLRVKMGLEFREQDGVAHFRVLSEVDALSSDEGLVADIKTTHVVSYRFDSPPELLQDHIQSFAEDVAIMAVFPYVRAVSHQLGALLDLPAATLGILKRGDVRLTEE